jgi:hypothetical protein
MQRISRQTSKGKSIQTKPGKETIKFTFENIIK